ncbi:MULTISPECIES: type IX secretion system protein PorQ [unclassified Paraflavitalea]|uniref:type IX secretion system protein PorQ n=1 Tax=unclassified Paraflavitalea TaxID=2798305 RepID=UPI003D34DF0F
MRLVVTFILTCCVQVSISQTLGGNSNFSFAKTPASPRITALGGYSVVGDSKDVDGLFQNPALLHPSQHQWINSSFQVFPASINTYQLSSALYSPKLETVFGIGIHYFRYGTITSTDAAGTIYGEIHPNDYVVQLSASRSYANKWRYGLSMKILHSSYGFYRAAGLGMDAGLTYTDTAQGWQVGFALQNMGAVLKPYQGTSATELPFDMKMGVSKKLLNAPIKFFLNAQQMQRFRLDSSDIAPSSVNGIMDNFMRHLSLGTQIFLGDKVEISAGYNYLRRKELNIGRGGNGLNGFSLGIGLILKKLNIQYSRTNYQSNVAINHFGVLFTYTDFTIKKTKR